MATDIFGGYKYDKNETVGSPIIAKGTLIDYAELLKRESKCKNSTKIKNSPVIDMDAVKNSLGIIPKPQSMDLVLIASKINIEKKSAKTVKKYFLADFKFNVTSPENICKNISNEDVKGKFNFSCEYIRSVDFNILCCDTAYFIFNDKNFEQIKNRWGRRNLNFPKNVALRQSDFELIF